MKADFYLFSHYKIKKILPLKKEYINMVLVNPTKNNQMHCYFFFFLQEKMQGIMSSKINVFIDSPQDVQQLSNSFCSSI